MLMQSKSCMADVLWMMCSKLPVLSTALACSSNCAEEGQSPTWHFQSIARTSKPSPSLRQILLTNLSTSFLATYCNPRCALAMAGLSRTKLPGSRDSLVLLADAINYLRDVLASPSPDAEALRPAAAAALAQYEGQLMAQRGGR